MKVKDVKGLKPIVKRTIKTLYGEAAARNIMIRKADQSPIFGEKKWWNISAEFSDSKFKYSVSMNISIADGVVKKTEETGRASLPKKKKK
jgi:hypothetical protein